MDIAMPLLPSMAPLCVPMVNKLAETAGDVGKLQSAIWERRSSIFTYMFPYVKSEQLIASQPHAPSNLKAYRVTQQWLRKSLIQSDPKRRTIAYTTLNEWTTPKRGLLRLREWGRPDFQSAAALLIMRMSSSLKSGWLPSYIAPEEPAFWIWMQPDPEAVPIPVPLPLDEQAYRQFPPSTLLWSEWPGAGWLDGWLAIGNFGAIRWAGRRDGHWALSRKEIGQWMPTLPMVTFPAQFVRDLEVEQFHTNATKALYHLAYERFVPEHQQEGNSHHAKGQQSLLSGL